MRSVEEYVHAGRLDALDGQRGVELFVETQPPSLELVSRVGLHRGDGSVRHLFAHFGFLCVPHLEGSAACSQVADSAALELHAAASADERERRLDCQSLVTAAPIKN